MFDQPKNRRGRIAALLALLLAAAPAIAQPSLDICGCAGDPASNGDFDTGDAASLAAVGATVSGGSVEVPLPADGRLVFDSFVVERIPAGNQFARVSFVAPAGLNPPVQLLVAGDVTIASNASILVSGQAGGTGLANSGGLGGPGGFRGGDGAFPEVNFADVGGAGLGPGGGAPGRIDGLPGPPVFVSGVGGSFVGSDQLIPILGGGGGGGGGAFDLAGSTCQASGGGGGGGALLIAANGTITIDGIINANGGAHGSNLGNAICASFGGGGSGGAVRLVAAVVVTSRFQTQVSALGGTGGGLGEAGSVRIEAFDSEGFAINRANPRAQRAPAPGPIENPFRPTVEITAVDGVAPPSPPAGSLGGVDVTVSAPGLIPIDLSTDSVPAGTVVNVVVKPRVGGEASTLPVTLNNCSDGSCDETVVVDLPAGRYVIEAEATFQTP